MANPEHVKLLKQGVNKWNQWRGKNRLELPDLDGANFGGANLRTVNLRHANLRGADFSGADLNWADLNWAKLREATLTDTDLSGADLGQVDFTFADLSNANLQESDLWAADFSHAELTDVNIRRAAAGYTTFVENDLSKVKNLGSVRHRGPSFISIDTIFRSGGRNLLLSLLLRYVPTFKPSPNPGFSPRKSSFIEMNITARAENHTCHQKQTESLPVPYLH
jgi:hypothetical protein